MSDLDELLEWAICAMCGKGLHIDDHEGRVACDGCNLPIDNCTCEKASAET